MALGLSKPDLSKPDWIDGMQVQERRLQEYFCKRQHLMSLKSAADTLKHTLTPLPTSIMEDERMNFGNSVMLQNGFTGGLLQVDVAGQVQVSDGSRSGASGMPLSTGSIISACARNVFTVSRVNDNDGFPNDGHVHYGQVIRFGTNPRLHDRPLYLYASAGGCEDAGLGAEETLACCYPHAAAGTQWRVLRADARAAARADAEAGGTGRLAAGFGLSAGGRQSDIVGLGEPCMLVGVNAARSICSDGTVRMNNYGNEWRVYGGKPVRESEAPPLVALWTFVNTVWTEDMVAAAVRADSAGVSHSPGVERTLAIAAGSDPGEFLLNPVYRAERELVALAEEGDSVYEVLLRVYPALRRAGMHVVRRLRTSCATADVAGNCLISLRTFKGVLSWVGILLSDKEVRQMADLFQAQGDQGSAKGDADSFVGADTDNEFIDYRRFFVLMEGTMPEIRMNVVRDAYAKLQASARAGLVEVSDLQRHWNPGCHPEVQKGILNETEGLDEFLRQWNITSADGLVTWEDFLDYYRDVSAAVEASEAFVEIVRCGWGL
mmetsp:Transcript_74003/g.158616  ORF Transcript_74003/g.158616 Transcript_74003/m.158616 type:complete len:548 (-) Transcript_74003:90-1733(-)